MFLLADISPTNWIFFGVILLLLVLYPVFMFLRNKKEKEKFEEINNGLKEGDKVVTSSGVYGTIISMTTNATGGKTVTLETGDENHKGYISVDILAIYSVVKEPSAEIVETPVEVVETKKPVALESSTESSTKSISETKNKEKEPVIEKMKKIDSKKKTQKK